MKFFNAAFAMWCERQWYWLVMQHKAMWDIKQNNLITCPFLKKNLITCPAYHLSNKFFINLNTTFFFSLFFFIDNSTTLTYCFCCGFLMCSTILFLFLLQLNNIFFGGGKQQRHFFIGAFCAYSMLFMNSIE